MADFIRRGALWACLCLALTWQAQAQARRPSMDELGKALMATGTKANETQIARQFGLAAMQEGRVDDAIDLLRTYMKERVPDKNPTILSETELETLASAAEMLSFLAMCKTAHAFPKPETCEWLLGTNERLTELVNTVSMKDNWSAACTILDDLYTFDPEHREDAHKVIVAMALVWDQPRRPRPHHQMGTREPRVEPLIRERYVYFRDLYASNDRKMPLEKLSIRALTFTVSAPVPISELVWTRENVRGNLGSWNRKYFDIDYTMYRIDQGQFSWPHGEYTLAEIEERGGICVDQAYYATITAQAYGVPAMLFTGEGRRGGHAWTGYMKSETAWEMDVGRYTYDKYATGHTYDPQTNEKMTDHDVNFSCSRAFASKTYDQALRMANVGFILMRLEEYGKARRYAATAQKLVGDFLRPWEIMEEIMVRKGDKDGLLKIYDAKAAHFKRYPDLQVETSLAASKLLRESNRHKEADARLDTLMRRVKDRMDLYLVVGKERIEIMKETDNDEGARDLYEEMMLDNNEEGGKLLPLVEEYLRFTANTEQTKEAAKFMERLVRRVPDDYRIPFRELQIIAYRNAGDDRKADRIRDKID